MWKIMLIELEISTYVLCVVCSFRLALSISLACRSFQSIEFDDDFRPSRMSFQLLFE